MSAAAGEAAPAAGPGGGETAPVGGETAPVSGETAPASGETAPASGETAPAGGEQPAAGGAGGEPLPGTMEPGGAGAAGAAFPTIADAAAAAPPNISILMAAVNASNLTAALSDPTTTWTIFAPTDEVSVWYLRLYEIHEWSYTSFGALHIVGSWLCISSVGSSSLCYSCISESLC